MEIDDQKKKSVNHTAKRIVPFRAKNYRQLPTIAERQSWSSIINNYQQLTEDKKMSTIINNYQQLFSLL